uniref:Uncharacterized protein n=1 Tax=Micrurus paraensis TaxID=1970185 RepID=A0A2D4KS79_9SAUR
MLYSKQTAIKCLLKKRTEWRQTQSCAFRNQGLKREEPPPNIICKKEKIFTVHTAKSSWEQREHEPAKGNFSPIEFPNHRKGTHDPALLCWDSHQVMVLGTLSEVRETGAGSKKGNEDASGDTQGTNGDTEKVLL